MARMTIPAALEAIKASPDEDYGVLLERGSLEVGYYAPAGVDDQEPHERDEVYVVQSGRGRFLLGGQERDFEPGEVLFVPAGVEHRFLDFTDDFGAWVIFYGPPGGEG